MLDKYYIRQHVGVLTLKAAQKYNISPEKCHLGHLVLEGMLQRPNKLNQIDAATDENESNISVAKRSICLANAMTNSGLNAEDTVIVMGNCHLDLVIPFYACHFNGYSVSGIDPRTGASDLVALFPYVKPKIVFCDKSCEEKVKEAFIANKLKGEIVIFDEKDSDLEAFIRQHKGTDINFRPTVIEQDKVPAWLILTSGTTGAPKVVSVTYKNVLNAVCCWWERFNENFEIQLAMGGLHWMTSYVFLISAPLRNYTKLQSSVQITARSLVDIINKYKPNSTVWASQLLSEFLKVSENCCDLSCFKHIALGGAYIDQELVDKFRKKYPAYLDFTYGQTELMVPVFNYSDKTPPGSVGYPSSKYQFRLVAEDGSIVDKPNKNGELWIKGDDFFKEYLHNPEETSQIYTQDGWLKTGDIFCRDEKNFYYFVERKKLLIKHLNFLISPVQLEEVIRRHPGVEDVCVVGVPHPDYIDMPVAAIVKKEGHEFDPQEIFDLLKKSLSELKQLNGGLFFVDSFIYTPSGKINRAKIKDLALTAPKILSK